MPQPANCEEKIIAMLTSTDERTVLGIFGWTLGILAGCSATGLEDDPTADAADGLRPRGPMPGFEHRRPGRGPHHDHGDCGRGGSAGRGGSPNRGGAAGTGGGATGEGGTGAGGTGGKGGAGGTGGTAGACLPVGPMLLDDFEDGDTVAASTPAGGWFSVNDASEGSVQSPSPWLPTAGGAEGSAFAACTSGSGFLSWGALIGMVFPTDVEGVLSCVDVSSLQGIRFKARGSGHVKLNLALRATTAVEDGGLCSGPACGFSPYSPVGLSEDWQAFDVPWGLVHPGNLPFDPRDLLGVHFQAYDEFFPALTPIAFDFCVDDVELY
jgi:hypothetical protein